MPKETSRWTHNLEYQGVQHPFATFVSSPLRGAFQRSGGALFSSVALWKSARLRRARNRRDFSAGSDIPRILHVSFVERSRTMMSSAAVLNLSGRELIESRSTI